MADPRKKPENPNDKQTKDKKPPKDLELPEVDEVSEDEILEILEVAEDDSAAVEVTDDDAVIEVVEGDDSEAVEFGSDVTAAQHFGSLDEDEEPVLVELASDRDLASLMDDMEAHASPSDVIMEALESGVDLEGAAEVKSAKSVKSSSDSDIDLGAMLDENDPSSAVNLGGSGTKRALPASDAVETKLHSDEAVEINDDLLVGAPGAPKDDAVLVTPKKKNVPAADVDLEAEFAKKFNSASSDKSHSADDAIAVEDDAIALGVDDVVAVDKDFTEPSQPPVRGKKGREPELVGEGVGSGRRRGGFMPFLFGGIIATLLLGGGAAAAWYFDMLPKSPTAQQQPPPRKIVAPPPPVEKGDEEFETLKKAKEAADTELTALKSALATANVPAEPEKLEAHLKNLAVAKLPPTEIKPPPAGDNKLDAIIAQRDAAMKQVELLQGDKAAADKAINDLQAANMSAKKNLDVFNVERAVAQKTIDELKAENKVGQDAVAMLKKDLANLTAGDKNGLMQQRDAAQKERDDAKKALQVVIDQQKTLVESQKSAEQALASAKSELGEASKAREALQSAYDTAKLELEKARTGSPASVVTDLNIADSLIKQTDPKAQGQGYIILGASQTRAGKASEGLGNILKGLKMVDPQLALQTQEKTSSKQPSTTISKAPVMPPVEVASPSNPLAAEKFYTKGLEFFWARSYSAAETQFSKAVGSYNDDARYYYYLGLSRYMQGSTDKRKQAHADFVQGVQLENSHHPAASEINASLERIQGDLRTMLNAYRERRQ